MATRRREPIIEFVGVPGSGKSTIFRGFRETYPSNLAPQIPRAPCRGSFRLFWSAAVFFLSLRPLELNDLNRFRKIIEGHHVYEKGLSGPLVLEQGLIQRLWSAVVDRSEYRPDRLGSFVKILAEAAPDVIVWVKVRPEIAAKRIVSRPRGNSRYERMEEGLIVDKLEPATELYAQLIGLYRQYSKAAILELSGEEPVSMNVERVADFVRLQLSGVSGENK